MTGNFKAVASMKYPGTRQTFQDVSDWLKSIPEQADGPQCRVVCEGVPYVEFASGYTCRNEPFDRALAEAYCAFDVREQVKAYLSKTEGTMYWRNKFEHDVWEPRIFTEMVATREQYRNSNEEARKIIESRAEIDHTTDIWGVVDHRFITVKCYARMARTDKQPEWPEVTNDETKA